MKLCFSPTSPYVRKVLACAITREIDGQIELVTTDANASPPEFVTINPLSKVPALVTDDGVALFDSPVICEYLDSVGDALPMFPEHGAARWRALKLQAMGDGILDASVPRRGEAMKPQDEGRLFRFTLKHSILLASITGLLVVFYAYVAPQLAP